MLDFGRLPYYPKITYIFQNVSIVITFVGLISNTLSIVVLSRKRLRSNSFAFYIRIMNICDMIVLFTKFRNWSAFMLDADLLLTADFFCKISDFTTYFAGRASTWHLTLITFDRFATIVVPQKFQILKNVIFKYFCLH